MLKIVKRLKKNFNNFINNMAESNEESFGSGKLDCCDINKETPKQTTK